jgi:hypothetical protein
MIPVTPNTSAVLTSQPLVRRCARTWSRHQLETNENGATLLTCVGVTLMKRIMHGAVICGDLKSRVAYLGDWVPEDRIAVTSVPASRSDLTP